MGIGAYRHVVTLEHPAAVLDPVTWYCAIQSAATQVVDGLTAFFVRGRYHPGITLETQLNFEGRTFQVQSVTDVDERHVELVLMCVEVVGRGKSLDRAPFITVQPVSSLTFGQSVTLTVEAGGTPPLSYQWLKNGIVIVGATGASYATGTLTAMASYTVRVSNAEGFVTSAPATVTVVTPATIVTPPQSSAVTPGQSLTLTVVATGTPPLVYQWAKNGVDVAGATSASYVTGPIAAPTVYTVRVANAYGSVTSAPATITLATPLLTNLVSYWSFETGWNDVHGTNHLTNVNGVTRVTGKLGQAADFEADSAQHLKYPDTVSPLGNEDFTYCVWFKFETLGRRVQLIAKQNPAIGQLYFVQMHSAGIPQFFLGPEAVGVTASSVTIADTAWHFLLAWHDAAGDTINLQIDNGVVFTQATGGYFAPAAALPVSIGAREWTGSEDYHDGLIDDVGLWRRVLTAQERTDLWNGGAGLAYPFA